jgi:hypothetical protein
LQKDLLVFPGIGDVPFDHFDLLAQPFQVLFEQINLIRLFGRTTTGIVDRTATNGVTMVRHGSATHFSLPFFISLF